MAGVASYQIYHIYIRLTYVVCLRRDFTTGAPMRNMRRLVSILWSHLARGESRGSNESRSEQSKATRLPPALYVR
eukprot:312385-Prorocentrum_minimum.AAC.5